MPLFTPKLFLHKPTETEKITPEDYNHNLDLLDDAIDQHESDSQAHGLAVLRSAVDTHYKDLFAHGADLSLYKLNKDSFGVFTEVQWKRPDGTLARKVVLSNGTPPYYTTKMVTCYLDDGITIMGQREYTLNYDVDNDLISEVLQ